jgi:hypothetical protein
MSETFPGWSGAGGTQDAAWRQVVLGDVFLPGVCTVNGLECGVDIDTKKGKGHDRPHSTDNGVNASKFNIEVWLTEKDWEYWTSIVDKINPRMNRQRGPLEIIHPEPNALGITHVRILSLSGSAPTARGGKKFRIDVVEWFDAPPIPVKGANAEKAKSANQKYIEDPKALARDMGKNQSYGPLPPSDVDNMESQLFR